MASYRLRYIFIFTCIAIIVILGIRRPMSSKQNHTKYDLVINEVMVNNRSSISDNEGDFKDWIEIYNSGDTAINLEGFGLSNDRKLPYMWEFPEKVLEPKEYCLIWASGKNKDNGALHANFEIKNNNKLILLTAPNNNWNNIFLLEPMGDNISYGRVDNENEFRGFDGGTPGEPNMGEYLVNGPNTIRLSEPKFSHPSGFYVKGFELSLKESDAIIYYTLDGSVPTQQSRRYTKSISLLPNANGATIIRARAYKSGYPMSNIVTVSYFIDANVYAKFNTPVISLVTDPKNLFDYKEGIYLPGKIFDKWKMDNPFIVDLKIAEANYNQRGKEWEREASFELIQPNGTVGISEDVGIRIHGGYSRSNLLKTLAIYARNEYGENDYLLYDFFNGRAKTRLDNNEIHQFSKLLLRTSATDSKYTFFRDAFMQSLVGEISVLDTQSSQISIVYINGEYYGIHNIREAYDKNYIYQHYNVEVDDVVMIKNPTGVAGVEIQEGFIGDEMHYNRIITYIKDFSLKDSERYKSFKTQIDIENFIDYNILQIYCDNRDWPGNNVSIWRKRTQKYLPNEPYGHDGRWRWLVYDLDYGFGLFSGEKAVENNSLMRATSKDGPIWPNPPWSTILLRSLLENDEFKVQFINTFADRLNTIYLPNVVINKIETFESIYYPNVEEHIKKWNLHKLDTQNWKNEIQVMKGFALKRPQYIYQHILEYFNLGGLSTVKIEMTEGGIVKINSIELVNSETPWVGKYFKEVPVTIEAIPKPGYKFISWEGITDGLVGNSITILDSMDIKANFQKISN